MPRLTRVDQRKQLVNRPVHGSQRRAPRRTVRPGSKVLFKKSPRFRFIGKSRTLHTADLIDISAEGLRARYSAPDKWSRPFDHIAIISADNTVILDDVYCRIISDFQVRNTPEGGCDRICGVKFKRLNHTQSINLELFIKEHTVRQEESAQWHVQFD